ncbi:MAG TPA: BatA domain-containing protein [Gemmatimonadaceae bacterium]|nr:BatA domain-containing protein [Gemmatimonadaceae bacterium]
MNFLAPAFLIGAAAVSAAVVVLHFIVTREPKTAPLPTARFAPDLPVRAQSRAIHLQDLLLLLLRVLLILAVGAALAQPVLRPPRRDVARIVLVDRSRAVADPAEVVDSARSLLGDGDALVLFDESASVVREAIEDSLASLGSAREVGRLSSALIAGLRAASSMRDAADSLEMVVVSPLVSEELDAATDSVRALWPGALRLIPVTARRDSSIEHATSIVGAADDPLRFALHSGSNVLAHDTVRVVRGSLSVADSVWVRGGQGRVLVYWPAGGIEGVDTPTLPPAWAPRSAADTVGAVIADDAVVVAPFVRYAELREPADSSSANQDLTTRVVARWVDGRPAATEEVYDRSCFRTVTVPVPARGDLVLRPRFAEFAAKLLRPCGGATPLTASTEARLAALAGTDEDRLVPRSEIAPPSRVPQPLVPWLYGAALAFAAGAMVVRRRASAATVTPESGGDA